MPDTPATSIPQSPREHGEISVYTLPNLSTWWSANWFREDRLIPVTSMQSLGSRGSATFDLLRNTRADDATGQFVDYSDSANPTLEAGNVVAITSGGDPTSGTVLWFGMIDTINETVLAGNSDTVGTASASELGVLFDRTYLDGFNKASEGFSINMDHPPLANVSTSQGIIGNAVAHPLAALSSYKVWASTVADMGTVWSRQDLLNHVLRFSLPASTDWPIFTITGDTGSISSTANPEVLNLSGMSLGQAIDYLIPHSRGLSWYVTPDFSSGAQLIINVASHSTTTVGTLPANTPVNVSYAQTGDNRSQDIINIEKSEEQPYDQIIVEGGPIIFGVTLAYDNGFLEAWDSNNESYYKTGATDQVDYDDLDQTEKNRRNQLARNGPLTQDVYRRYIVETDSTSKATICSSDAESPAAQYACPEIEYDGGWTINDDSDKSSPQCTMRLLDVIPIGTAVEESGLSAGGTIVDNQDTYAPVKVFRYRSADDEPWRDLTYAPADSSGASGYPPFAIEAESIGGIFRMGFADNEGLAENHWSTSDSPWFDSSGDPTEDWVSDYEDIRVSLGIESGQRLTLSVLRSGISSVRKIAKIYRPDLHVAIARKGLIIGLDGAGDPLEFATDKVVRDDYDAAKAVLDEAQGLLFRSRTSLTVTLAGADHAESHVSLGVMIGTLSDSIESTSITSNTMVSAIARSYTNPTPTTTWSTVTPPSWEIIDSQGSGGGTNARANTAGTILKSQHLRGAEDDTKRDRLRYKPRLTIPSKFGRYQAPMATLQSGDFTTGLSDGDGGFWMMPAIVPIPNTDLSSEIADLGVTAWIMWIDETSDPVLKVIIGNGTASPDTYSVVSFSALDTGSYTANDIYDIGIPARRGAYQTTSGCENVFTLDGGVVWAKPDLDLLGSTPFSYLDNIALWNEGTQLWEIKNIGIQTRSDWKIDKYGISYAQVPDYSLTAQQYVSGGGSAALINTNGWPTMPANPPLSDFGYGQLGIVRAVSSSSALFIYRDTSGAYWSSSESLTSYSANPSVGTTVVDGYNYRHTMPLGYNNQTDDNHRFFFFDSFTSGTPATQSGYYLAVN